MEKASFKGSLTREQFLFDEMRVAAALLCEGYSGAEAAEKIARENLFQYPTARTIKTVANACVKRLEALESPELVRAIAEAPAREARQIALYAMMLQNGLVYDFMVTCIGEKYRTRDFSFTRVDMNAYFLDLMEREEAVASWSDATINKIKSVLIRTLADNEYLESIKAERLDPVLICPMLEDAIRERRDYAALAAFNCLS